MTDGRILLGVVGRPHGVRGLVHVQSYAADPAALPGYGPLHDDAGRRWTLAWKRDGVAELRDAAGLPLPDRDAAARLTNTRLYVDRERLPAPEPDEFYLSDLVGLAAATADGAALGTVRAVHDYGAGASLELSGGELVPFTRAAVPEVDLPGRRIVVDMPHDVVVEPAAAARPGAGPPP